jgi:hypothetical protein
LKASKVQKYRGLLPHNSQANECKTNFTMYLITTIKIMTSDFEILADMGFSQPN